jgi:hypothetical protein
MTLALSTVGRVFVESLLDCAKIDIVIARDRERLRNSFIE